MKELVSQIIERNLLAREEILLAEVGLLAIEMVEAQLVDAAERVTSPEYHLVLLQQDGCPLVEYVSRDLGIEFLEAASIVEQWWHESLSEGGVLDIDNVATIELSSCGVVVRDEFYEMMNPTLGQRVIVSSVVPKVLRPLSPPRRNRWLALTLSIIVLISTIVFIGYWLWSERILSSLI